jgi:hypothetical protein
MSNLEDKEHLANCHNQKQQRHNSSGYKGVSYDASRNKWKAAIKEKQKSIFLGRFDTPEEAFDAYVKKARELGRTERHIFG